MLRCLVRLANIEVAAIHQASPSDLLPEFDSITSTFTKLPWVVLGRSAREVSVQVPRRLRALRERMSSSPAESTKYPAVKRVGTVQSGESQRTSTLPELAGVVLGEEGNWVALRGDRVIASEPTAQAAYARAEQYGVGDVLVFRVPDAPDRITLL